MWKVFFLSLLAIQPLSADEVETLPRSIYEIDVRNVQGQNVSLGAYRGRVLLIVNVASQDANAAQIGQLQELYEKFQEHGLVVLAFPSNDFLNAELESDKEIRMLYTEKYHVTFPLFDKIKVTGPNRAPLFRFLTASRTNPHFGWEIDWNFNKFLIDRNGEIIARFNTKTVPTDQRVQDAIQKALAQ